MSKSVAPQILQLNQQSLDMTVFFSPSFRLYWLLPLRSNIVAVEYLFFNSICVSRVLYCSSDNNDFSFISSVIIYLLSSSEKDIYFSIIFSDISYFFLNNFL